MKSLSLKVSTSVVSLALALAGCGLISSDISKITFDLPTETYTFDTSMWGNLPMGMVPSVPCTSDMDCCTAATLVGMSCTSPQLDCNTSTSTCEASVPESASSSINLAMQVPQLQDFGGKALSNVTISKITYSVSNNTMNIDLPAMTIYLAPDKVTDPTDPRAVPFGTTMPIPKMTDPTNQQVMLVPNASAVFSMFTSDISNPFNIIAATTVKIEGGQPVPMGAVTLSVTGSLSAQL
ncbi:MAG TPA: hypothetical protein VN853_11665 [Polyangia bacterium]|nr:hypothetical protein [Polyangia bacterium]